MYGCSASLLCGRFPLVWCMLAYSYPSLHDHLCDIARRRRDPRPQPTMRPGDKKHTKTKAASNPTPADQSKTDQISLRGNMVQKTLSNLIASEQARTHEAFLAPFPSSHHLVCAIIPLNSPRETEKRGKQCSTSSGEVPAPSGATPPNSQRSPTKHITKAWLSMAEVGKGRTSSPILTLVASNSVHV